MREGLWRGSLAVCALLLFTVIFETYLLIYVHFSSDKTHNEVYESAKLPWNWNATRDAHNIGLTYEQCDSAFPDLWYAIDRSVSYWNNISHTITSDDVDMQWRREVAIRLLIHDNELRVVETNKVYAPQNHQYGKRTMSVLQQIQRALQGAQASGEKIPDIEFSMTMSDKPEIPRRGTHTCWTFTRHLGEEKSERVWLVPDWQFYAAPPYAEGFSSMRRKAMTHDKPLSEKILKAVWRGRLTSNREIRDPLMDATRNKSWADVDHNGPLTTDLPERVITMDNLCQWAFLIHTEGVSWSGRLKYLVNCDSVPIIHKLEYTTEWYHLLQPDGPNQNFIQVERDWSDLEEKMEYYLEHLDEAQRIADNVKATFRNRYTSPAAGACYWRRMMHAYSTVSFEPDPYETVDVSVAGQIQRQSQVRGWPVERFFWVDEEREVGWGYQSESGVG